MTFWLRRMTRDGIFALVILTVFGILSIATVVAARSGQVAAHKTQILLERSNRNSPILDIIKDCTTPGGECYNRNQTSTGNIVATVTAQQICVVQEINGYQQPNRTPAENEEIKGICSKLLNGDTLDLLRRVNALK